MVCVNNRIIWLLVAFWRFLPTFYDGDLSLRKWIFEFWFEFWLGVNIVEGLMEDIGFSWRISSYIVTRKFSAFKSWNIYRRICLRFVIIMRQVPISELRRNIFRLNRSLRGPKHIYWPNIITTLNRIGILDAKIIYRADRSSHTWLLLELGSPHYPILFLHKIVQLDVVFLIFVKNSLKGSNDSFLFWE